MGKHTPTPWKIYDGTDPLHVKIMGRYPDIGGAHVADILSPENAAFIVKACNAHDNLVAALEFIRDGYANQDVNHVDYRVKVYQVALDALEKVSS